MFVVESYGLAVVLNFITMICWGSWANSKKMLSADWPFDNFYWDYVLGVFLLATTLGVTLGSHGMVGRSFFVDLAQVAPNSVGLALLGGIIFNLANIMVVGAIELAGMAIVFPIAIGIALVLGVAINYFAVPSGDPWSLGGGVLCVVAAIIFDGLAYRKIQIKKTVEDSKKALLLAIFGGILLGFFYRFVAASMSLDFVDLEKGKLGPYGAFFVFSVGMILSNPFWQKLHKMWHIPDAKTPPEPYFSRGSGILHSIGIGGGLIWGLGMGFSIIASGKAGYAVSYGLGEGATMVAALWGIFVWKEFHGAPRGTSGLLVLMLSFFVVGLGLIVVSKI